MSLKMWLVRSDILASKAVPWSKSHRTMYQRKSWILFLLLLVDLHIQFPCLEICFTEILVSRLSASFPAHDFSTSQMLGHEVFMQGRINTAVWNMPIALLDFPCGAAKHLSAVIRSPQSVCSETLNARFSCEWIQSWSEYVGHPALYYAG